MSFITKIIFAVQDFASQLRYKQRFFSLEEEFSKYRITMQDKVKELEAKIGDPRYVVEKIFGRHPQYFNEQELSQNSKRQYFNEAQQILNSTAFNNIVNRLIATQCQEQARQYNPIHNTNVARDVQMTLNALELLREELEAVPDPDKTPDKQQNSKDFNPFDSV